MEEKQCTKCKETKPIDAFDKRHNSKTPYQSWCRECYRPLKHHYRTTVWAERIAERNKIYWDQLRADPIRYEEFRQKSREKNRLRDFNITPEDYQAMLKQQSGLCAICGKPETSKFKGTLRALSIDHDHKTGQVRGLLCFICNTRLAYFEDEAFVASINSYLRRFKE